MLSSPLVAIILTIVVIDTDIQVCTTVHKSAQLCTSLHSCVHIRRTSTLPLPSTRCPSCAELCTQLCTSLYNCAQICTAVHTSAQLCAYPPHLDPPAAFDPLP